MQNGKSEKLLQGVMPLTLSNIPKKCVGLSNLLPPLVHDKEDLSLVTNH